MEREPQNDNHPPPIHDVQLDLDEHGGVWLTLEGDLFFLGRRDEVSEELCRFLSEVDYGDCG